MALPVDRLTAILRSLLDREGALFRAVRAVGWRSAIVTAGLSTLFVISTCLPLRPSGIFRDLIDADATARAGSLPTADPLLPYADHARFAVLNSGGAAIEWAAWNVGGAGGLVVLSSALFCGTIALWGTLFVRRTGEFSAAIPAALWLLAVQWGTYDAGGTERFGWMLMPAVLLLLEGAGIWNRSIGGLARTPSSAIQYAASASLVALLALWANLDASWLIGLGVVWIVMMGRTLEIVRSRMTARRTETRPTELSLDRSLALALAATLATLLQPYGWKLWGLATLPYDVNPFVAALGPLAPTSAWSLSGAFAALAVVGAVLVIARRLARWNWTEGLLLAVAVAATFAHPLARVWTLPIVGLIVLPPLWVALVDRLRWRGWLRTPSVEAPAESYRSPLPAAVLGLSFCGALVLTPVGPTLLGFASEPLERVVVDAPLAEIPPGLLERGVTFAPPWWSDALAFQATASRVPDLAANESTEPSEFVAPSPTFLADSRSASLPPVVRQDVERILRGDEGWSAALDRYETKTLILDARRQPELLAKARAERRWRETYASPKVALFVREERIR